MTYDPNTNEWTNVTVSGSGLKFIKDGSASLDETQFVQMGENEYLMSARYFGAGSRKFYRLTFTSATTATVTEVSQSGMTLAGAVMATLSTILQQIKVLTLSTPFLRTGLMMLTMRVQASPLTTPMPLLLAI